MGHRRHTIEQATRQNPRQQVLEASLVRRPIDTLRCSKTRTLMASVMEKKGASEGKAKSVLDVMNELGCEKVDVIMKFNTK